MSRYKHVDVETMISDAIAERGGHVSEINDVPLLVIGNDNPETGEESFITIEAN